MILTGSRLLVKCEGHRIRMQVARAARLGAQHHWNDVQYRLLIDDMPEPFSVVIPAPDHLTLSSICACYYSTVSRLPLPTVEAVA